jgi:hypothetical protein
MRRLLLAMVAAVALLSPAKAADELPSCTSDQVTTTLTNVIRPAFVIEQTDYEHSDDAASKRWCYAYFSSPYLADGSYRMGSPWQEAVFTVEWINKSENRFWLQVTKQQAYRKYGDERDFPKTMRH